MWVRFPPVALSFVMEGHLLDNEMKNNVKVNIDDIPDLNMDVLDEISAEETELFQEELSLSMEQSVTEETVAVQTEEAPLPEIDMEVIDFIFDESDKKVQLFEEEEFDADALAIFDQDNRADYVQDYDESEDDDLVFVDAISVRDRRKLNNIQFNDQPSYDDIDQMKTKRRSHDEFEVKKERSIAFTKRNIVFIGIGILILLVIIGAISVGIKKFKANHSDLPSVSEDGDVYQVENQKEIEEFMTEYFNALADHDTYVLKEVLSPVYDNEMKYNGIFSDYVDAYDNLICYAKDGLKEGDYIVAVYYEMKYAKVLQTAPGMQFFYVETDQDGELYINNVYGQHNLTYRESETDPSIENLIASYQGEADMSSLIQQVQTKYDEAINSNNNLKEMIDVTIPGALEDWYAEMGEFLEEPEEPVVDDPVEDDTEEPVQPENTGVSEASGTVYATDLVNIRKEPSTDADVLLPATFGMKLKRVGTTDNGWTKVKTGDTVGYIKSEFVSESKPTPSAGVVITLKESLNLRAAKDETSDLINTVPEGTSVKVLEPDSNGWTKVDYNGVTGYIRTDLLTAN